MDNLQPWEKLAKLIIWKQLGEFEGRHILDFGSGAGITANHYAKNNFVTAIEPSEDMLNNRCKSNNYEQIIGSTERLKDIADESFDVIICHNVLEYADDRKNIVNEFYRVLKPNGVLSVVKHNRNGRVMQMVVLLNNFETANQILDGKNGSAKNFGTINYYEDDDIINWCNNFKIEKTYGLRTFWDLQQNQDIQKDEEWQNKMIAMETRVSELESFQNIAFFHHLIIRK